MSSHNELECLGTITECRDRWGMSDIGEAWERVFSDPDLTRRQDPDSGTWYVYRWTGHE